MEQDQKTILALGKFMTWIIGAIIATIVMTICLVYEAYAIKYLWLWFVSGPFALRQLTVPLALGLSLLITLFLPTARKSEESGWKLLGRGLTKITILWAIGAIVYFGFM